MLNLTKMMSSPSQRKNDGVFEPSDKKEVALLYAQVNLLEREELENTKVLFTIAGKFVNLALDELEKQDLEIKDKEVWIYPPNYFASILEKALQNYGLIPVYHLPNGKYLRIQ